jgi:hypothetical protein
MLMVLCWICGGASLSPEISAQSTWGTVTGQFVLGRSDESRIRRLTNMVPRNVFIDTRTRGIANIVLTLRVANGAPYPLPHREYDVYDKVIRRITINNPIQPRVTLIRTGQQLQLTNALADPVEVKVDTIKNHKVHQKLNPMRTINLQFEKEEQLPVVISLLPPSQQIGWLVVRDSPYMAVSDTEGRFTISNLPTGDWTFQAWHERCGYVTEIRRGGTSESWPRGHFQIHIPPSGKQDLGKFELSLECFEKARP